MHSYSLNSKEYPKECALYEKHKKEITEYCKNHITGNWILSFILRGNTEDTVKPTIVVFYEGNLSTDWKPPEVEGIPFMALKETFWGAMRNKDTIKKETTKEDIKKEENIKISSCIIA